MLKCDHDKLDQQDPEEHSKLTYDNVVCNQVQWIENDCVKEVRETCIGFVQRQVKIYLSEIVQERYLDQGVSSQCVPQCLKPNKGQYSTSTPLLKTYKGQSETGICQAKDKSK